MRLHHAPGSPHSASVRMALAEKGLDCELVEVDLTAFANLTPRFLALNAAGQVPVLEDGGCVIAEAFFILLYLEEAHPEPALGGADPQARYLVQRWGKYVETHIAPNLALVRWAERAGLRHLPRPALVERLPAERQALWHRAAAGFSESEVSDARTALAKAADRLADALGEHDWLAGPTLTLADIAVFPHAARLAANGIAPPNPVARWLERMAARPGAAADASQETQWVTMGPERGRWG